MKKLILALLFLLLSCSISFAENQQLAWMGPVIAGGCTISCTDDSGDTYNQGFEDGNPPSGWSSKSGAYLVDRPGTQSPTQLCSKTANITTTSAASYIEYDYGSDLSEFYYRIYIYITSDLQSGEIIAAGSNSSSWGTECFKIAVYNNQINVASVSNTGWLGGVTYNAWHRIDIHYKAGETNGSSVKIDGGSETTFTGAYAVRYFQLGTNASETINVNYDLFAISTSGWIGAP